MSRAARSLWTNCPKAFWSSIVERQPVEIAIPIRSSIQGRQRSTMRSGPLFGGLAPVSRSRTISANGIFKRRIAALGDLGESARGS